MRGLLTRFLIGFAGLIALFAGPFVLLGTVVGVGMAYGRVWRFVARLGLGRPARLARSHVRRCVP
jgi:hypothetical protein